MTPCNLPGQLADAERPCAKCGYLPAEHAQDCLRSAWCKLTREHEGRCEMRKCETEGDGE